jgi:hypothetical protein
MITEQQVKKIFEEVFPDVQPGEFYEELKKVIPEHIKVFFPVREFERFMLEFFPNLQAEKYFLKLERVAHENIKEYFPDVHPDHRESFWRELERVTREETKVCISGEARTPPDSSIKKDAKKLLTVLKKIGVFPQQFERGDSFASGGAPSFSDLFICAEAGLPEYALKAIASACDRIESKAGAKHKNMAMRNTIFSLDVLFKQYSMKPQSKRVDFVNFVHSCFLVVDRDYKYENAKSHVAAYLSSEQSSPKKAESFLRMYRTSQLISARIKAKKKSVQMYFKEIIK